jgi:hypothetical protein
MITGATGGLGKAFSAELALRGSDLFLTDLRQDALEILARGLERGHGIEALHRAADLTDAGSRSALFASIANERLRFRGLVNVAGGDHEGLFRERKAHEITEIVRLNIESTLMMTHCLLPYRDHSVPFRIINVSSMGAYFAMPVKATYAASKRFLLDFSLALRSELRDENVVVTVLCPAGMPTNSVCIEAIEAQGLMGYLTTQNAGSVAFQAVEGALKGRAIVVPGALNRAMLWLSAFIPSAQVAHIVGTRWGVAHQRRGLS